MSFATEGFSAMMRALVIWFLYVFDGRGSRIIHDGGQTDQERFPQTPRPLIAYW
jgi:hypothetical protein